MARGAGMMRAGSWALWVGLAAVALDFLAGSAVATEVVNLPTPPPSGGPNNGGHFMFGTVSWKKLQHQPPKIHFTLEASFRRSYGATNFRGSGGDGFLVTGDTFKPSGLETIMFDFGDGAMLSPIEFTVQAWSAAEDWVQGVASFEHTYAALSSSTPYEYSATFKGCCRRSDLAANADTAWRLVSLLNVRDDDNSPRVTVLPLQTVPRRVRPADAEPAFYVPASDEIFGSTGLAPLAFTTRWEKATAIGHAPAGLAGTTVPQNLANVLLDERAGLLTLAAGPTFANSGDDTRCSAGGVGSCAGLDADGNPTLPGLQPGLYPVVLNLHQRASSAPVEFLLRVVDEDAAHHPRVSAEPGLLYPAFSYARHVAYLGFPIEPFQLTGRTSVHGVSMGFTVGRLPSGMRVSTVAGGSSVQALHCHGGSEFCAEDPSDTCSESSEGCTCMPAMTGKRCDGPHGAPCFGGGTCKACWHEGDCPTADGNVTFSWTPTAGQAGTHVICVDATVQRDAHLCQGAAADDVGCAPLSSPPECVSLEVYPDPAPRVWTSFTEDLDPYAHSGRAYLGRTLSFTVYASDENCHDLPAISMGEMPPGASMELQTQTVERVTTTVTSYVGANTTSTVSCAVQHRRFNWHIPLTYGGYRGRHCFYATDSCGDDAACSGELQTSEVCVEFQVAKCKYAVSREQSLAEVAAHFGSDWIAVWNLNSLTSPDYTLHQHQVLNVGHPYVVHVGDTILKIARRFGTTEKSLLFLNHELGVLQSHNLSVGQELCLVANSCFGEVQSVWDGNPMVDESLERWYAGVKQAYAALREAQNQHLAERGGGPSGVARRLLAAGGADAAGRMDALMGEMQAVVAAGARRG